MTVDWRREAKVLLKRNTFWLVLWLNGCPKNKRISKKQEKQKYRTYLQCGVLQLVKSFPDMPGMASGPTCLQYIFKSTVLVCKKKKMQSKFWTTPSVCVRGLFCMLLFHRLQPKEMAAFITLLIIIPSACIIFKTNAFSRSWCRHFWPSREQLLTLTHQRW